MNARKPEEVIEMDVAQLESLVARIEQGTLEQEDLQTLRAVLESYFYVTQLIDKKSTTCSSWAPSVFALTLLPAGHQRNFDSESRFWQSQKP
jgi:hypothetical protein